MLLSQSRVAKTEAGARAGAASADAKEQKDL